MERRMTLSEAARRYGVEHQRLRRAAVRGRLPAVKAGPGRTLPYLVAPADVEAYLATVRRGPRPKRKGEG